MNILEIILGRILNSRNLIDLLTKNLITLTCYPVYLEWKLHNLQLFR